MTELKNIIIKLDRYKGFTLLDKPVKFNELMVDKSISVVQTHSTQILEIRGRKDIFGFCGQFAWENNKIKSLDGDSYNEDMTVLGYEWFFTDEGKTGLDILVGEDW